VERRSSLFLYTKEKKTIKYIHKGPFVAKVEVMLEEDETGWSPYLGVGDAYKLDEIKEASQKKNIKLASKYGNVYEMHPIDNL